ncbi:MAG: RNA polymerase sigma factor [Bacteroidetes bacterium]|nr:RNA polymerase sigma factor [Bacteroidota bacterium]
MSSHFELHIVPISDKMYRYALSILKEPETAHDVVQECLMKIWDKRNMLDTIDNMEAWVIRITRNQCYDWVRTNRFSVLTVEEMEKSDPIDADQMTLVNNQQDWLDQVLESLPQKQKEVFHLREVEDLSYQDIADVLSVSLDEVKVTLHRARNKVRSSMQKIEGYGIAN